DHDHAFLGGNVVGGNAHLVAEAAGLGHGSDLVDDYGSHLTVLSYFPPARAWNMPVSETIFEKPSASCGVHSPWDSPYTPLDTAMSECGDSTPSTNKLPGRNSTWTLPVTRSCDDRNNASMSRHTGSSSCPSCTQSPYGPASDSLMRCWRGVSTSFSSSRWAVSSASAAGASKATRPLVPMMVSPRWMPRPMLYGAPRVSSASTTSTADIILPSMPTGRPFSKWIVCFAGGFGWVNASFESTQAESGMLPSEVSVSFPPMVTPHSPRLTE